MTSAALAVDQHVDWLGA